MHATTAWRVCDERRAGALRANQLPASLCKFDDVSSPRQFVVKFELTTTTRSKSPRTATVDRRPTGPWLRWSRPVPSELDPFFRSAPYRRYSRFARFARRISVRIAVRLVTGYFLTAQYYLELPSENATKRRYTFSEICGRFFFFFKLILVYSVHDRYCYAYIT